MESAAVGHREPGAPRSASTRCWCWSPGHRWMPSSPPRTQRLPDHQRMRSASIWTSGPLPRTEGTRKLKRAAIRRAGWTPARAPAPRRGAGGEAGNPSSPDSPRGRAAARHHDRGARPELARARRADGRARGQVPDPHRREHGSPARGRSTDLKTLLESRTAEAVVDEPVDFPRWNRRRLVGIVRRASQATWILPIARMFAWVRVSGLRTPSRPRRPGRVRGESPEPPGCPGHPGALPGALAGAVAPAMAKEFFKAHFFPEQHSTRQVFTNRLNYYLAAFFFNAFPLPQREAGARQTLRYIGEVTGDGFSVLIFPEGVRSAYRRYQAVSRRHRDDRLAARPPGGAGASRRRDACCIPSWKMARPGPVR